MQMYTEDIYLLTKSIFQGSANKSISTFTIKSVKYGTIKVYRGKARNWISLDSFVIGILL